MLFPSIELGESGSVSCYATASIIVVYIGLGSLSSLMFTAVLHKKLPTEINVDWDFAERAYRSCIAGCNGTIRGRGRESRKEGMMEG